MAVYRKSLLQILPLILLLLAGPLQAKVVFTNLIMDKITQKRTINMCMHIQDEETCSHEYKTNLNIDYDDTASLNTVSCHKKITEQKTDHGKQINIPISDLLFESEIDPPQIKFATLNLTFPSQTISSFLGFPRTGYTQLGSKIHLITQRLRI